MRYRAIGATIVGQLLAGAIAGASLLQAQEALPDPGYAAAAAALGSPATGTMPASSARRASKRAPRAVTIARTKTVPNCTVFVDAAAGAGGSGTVQNPFSTIAAAVAEAPSGAIICVAEGTYAEELTPGAKHFTLAGGFQSGQDFEVRDSAVYVSKAMGNGGSFLRIMDPGPQGNKLTAIDGFEITGYAQAIVRDFYISQRFDITNNFIHDNECGDDQVGAAFLLVNVSGTIGGNVIADNECGRGGGGALVDNVNENTVTLANNLVQGNAGTEPGSAHGGGFYLFGNTLKITGNRFVDNRVTGWGGGMYVGAFVPGGQPTNALLAWNVYNGNRAGIYGGGFFCDDGAECSSDHEIYYENCGGNIYLDGGSDGSGPTIARFDHLTSVRALNVACGRPGPGVFVTKNNADPDSYSFTNTIFWENAARRDIQIACDSNCGEISVDVSYSMMQKNIPSGGTNLTIGPGMLPPKKPRFVDPNGGNFHLKSVFGHWTPTGYVADSVNSPLLAKGDPDGRTNKSPPRAGNRTEMGAYGNSVEASYVR